MSVVKDRDTCPKAATVAVSFATYYAGHLTEVQNDYHRSNRFNPHH